MDKTPDQLRLIIRPDPGDADAVQAAERLDPGLGKLLARMLKSAPLAADRSEVTEVRVVMVTPRT